jgi:tetratricopeptide (TPR) repeat protein
MKLKVPVIFILIISVCVIQISAQEKNKKESAAAVLEKTFKDSGIEAAETKFTELISKEKDMYTFNEQEFIDLGNSLRSSGRVKAAVSVLKMTTRLFPQSSNAWFNLGQTYVRSVNREKAIESYKKALELDTNNGMSRAELAWIDFRIDDARLETREIERFEPGVNTGLKGPYLGHAPPGKKPVVFAPGIVSVYGSNENTITFSPNGKEIYFGTKSGISMCKLTEHGWTAPKKTAIPGYEMYISPSTGKMYYTGGGIWEMERSADGWGKPRKLVDMGMFATLTQDEILYTTVFSDGAKIGRYLKVDGKYNEYEILGDQFNLSTFNAHPCVAPDGSFLVFDSNKPGGRGYTNLYISFRNSDGTWSTAIYLGDDINAPGTNNCCSLSPDGKYFFYTSHNDIYWVSAEVLKDFKPKKQ